LNRIQICKYVGLVSKYVFRFAVQVIGVGVDPLDVSLFKRLSFQALHVIVEDLSDEGRAGGGGADVPVDFQQQVSRKRDGNSSFHSTSLRLALLQRRVQLAAQYWARDQFGLPEVAQKP
jgi:hypothetical protein